MRAVGFVVRMVWKGILLAVILSLVAGCGFIAQQGNQPMTVPQAPQGMTYFEFMQDRIDAAKELKPSCGVGMFASLAILGPFYSVLYTYVAIEPDSFLASVTAPDKDIAKGVAGAGLSQIPTIWWETVERLSWTMLGSSNIGCKFRLVEQAR
ncbi:hypothetical protein [Anaerolinea sp.]|uniref:hypothetical protein n=1 Tax=Anaerolinea sp. TaxID=1872519 RepID=UPI002ACDBF9A|nr:hypothetical protein [Anaerolinea sp.]